MMRKVPEKYKAIYKVVQTFCFDHEDPVYAQRNMRFFSEGYDAFGIDDTALKGFRNRLIKEFSFSPAEFAEFGKYLFSTGKYEFGTLAIMILKKYRPRFDREVYEAIKEWLDTGVENWVHADLIATKFIPVFREFDLCSIAELQDWLLSSSKWTRRAVLMGMMQIKEEISPEVILALAEKVIHDSERVVQQGLGTMLKDAWVKYPEPIEAFLTQHLNDLDKKAVEIATMKMSLSRARQYRIGVKKFKPSAPNTPKRPGKPGTKPPKRKFNPDKK